MQRDRPYEEAFLEELEHAGAERLGIDAAPFVEHVRRRMQAGAERYEDRSLDLPIEQVFRELLDESPDIPGWALIAMQILNVGPEPPDGVAHHLFQACVYAAGADAHVRAARAALRG